MATPSNSQRAAQKRSAQAEFAQPPPAAAPTASIPQAGAGSRQSSGSSTRSSTRRSNVRAPPPRPVLLLLPRWRKGTTPWAATSGGMMLNGLIHVVQTAGPTTLPDREERDPSTHRDQTASRDAHAMVAAYSYRGRSVRRVRPVGLRIQHRL